MTPMAFIFALLFAVVILLPVAAVWTANRLALLAHSANRSQVLQFPGWPAHSQHRHIDAA